jgi:acetyl-CoA carboxylase biotin carboxyl carrier protein
MARRPLSRRQRRHLCATAVAPAPVAAAAVATPAASDDAHHPGAIPSPMVGIAYLLA